MVMLHHSGGLQDLVIDGVMSTYQRQRGLVMKVGPLPPHLLMRFGQKHHRLMPAMTPALPAGYAALRRFQLALRLAIPARMEDACPIRQGREGFNSQVDARPLPCRGERLDGHSRTGEADIPAIRFPADRHGLGRACNRATPPHGKAPDLRQHKEAVI
jgi:hypothetical protein